jgi:hypothetical protein
MYILDPKAGVQQAELVNTFLLKFQNPDHDVENCYQEYQFELNHRDFENRWGTLSITSFVSSISMASAYTEAFISFVGNTPGSIERMLIGFPFTLFNLYHQMTVFTGKIKSMNCRAYSKWFPILWVSSMCLLETAAVYVNDAFPEHEGCKGKRFRCPYSFSSAKFTARAVVLSALIIFSLTPCLTFLNTACLVLLLFLPGRILGFVMFEDNLIISLWSTGCTMVQLIIF